MVRNDVLLDFLKVLEAFEETILKDRVELVLDARQHRVLLVNVQTERLERGIPVKIVQVQQLEIVNHLRHAGLNFCLVKECLTLERIDWLWHFDMMALKPGETTLEPTQEMISNMDQD